MGYSTIHELGIIQSLLAKSEVAYKDFIVIGVERRSCLTQKEGLLFQDTSLGESQEAIRIPNWC